MLIYRKTLIASLIVLLTGCSGQRLHDELEVVSNKVHEDVQFQRDMSDAPAVIFVDDPQGPLISVPIIETPAYFNAPHAIVSQGLPFYLLVDDLARAHGLVVHYDDDMDIHLPVQLLYQDGTVKGALDALAASSGYAYTTTKKQLTWAKYETQRFDLSYVGGNYNYLIGNEAGTTADANSVLGSNTAQYQNITNTESSVFKEVQGTLDALVDGVGKIVLSEATSSVVVRTTPGRMKSVRDYLFQLNETLSTQILLDVQVLKFRHNNAAASGIDWNLVRQNASSTLSFAGALATNGSSALFSGTPTTMQAQATSGGWNASTLLISALEEQGTVSVVTEPRILTQVNRVAELKMAEIKGYIAQTVVTTDTGGQTSTSIEQGTVSDGYNIYVLTNVDSQKRIYLHISSMLSDILSIERKTVGTTAIESPNITESQFSQSLVLMSGQTVLANSLKQVASSNSASSPLDAETSATFKSGNQVIEEIVVLITPTIVNVGPSL